MNRSDKWRMLTEKYARVDDRTKYNILALVCFIGWYFAHRDFVRSEDWRKKSFFRKLHLLVTGAYIYVNNDHAHDTPRRY